MKIFVYKVDVCTSEVFEQTIGVTGDEWKNDHVLNMEIPNALVEFLKAMVAKRVERDANGVLYTFVYGLLRDQMLRQVEAFLTRMDRLVNQGQDPVHAGNEVYSDAQRNCSLRLEAVWHALAAAVDLTDLHSILTRMLLIIHRCIRGSAREREKRDLLGGDKDRRICVSSLICKQLNKRIEESEQPYFNVHSLSLNYFASHCQLDHLPPSLLTQQALNHPLAFYMDAYVLEVSSSSLTVCLLLPSSLCMCIHTSGFSVIR